MGPTATLMGGVNPYTEGLKHTTISGYRAGMPVSGGPWARGLVGSWARGLWARGPVALKPHEPMFKVMWHPLCGMLG